MKGQRWICGVFGGAAVVASVVLLIFGVWVHSKVDCGFDAAESCSAQSALMAANSWLLFAAAATSFAVGLVLVVAVGTGDSYEKTLTNKEARPPSEESGHDEPPSS